MGVIGNEVNRNEGVDTMDNNTIKIMIKDEPLQVISIIEERIRTIDYLEDQQRNDLLDYISAKVKAEISPHLRLARTVRRRTYPKWVEFQYLLEYFNLKETLTRENNYSPIPELILNHRDSMAVAQLEEYIIFFNKLHEREDKLYEKLFVQYFNEWVKPALLYAFDRVDIEKSDKEIVSYICKLFYTKFMEIRAESQGMDRMRRGGKWIYYKVKPVNEDEFRENDVMQTIFHEDRADFPGISEIAEKLTKRQTQLLLKLHDYIREDVRDLSTEEFYEKYRHKRMNYRRTAEELGHSYGSFVKNIERIKQRIS